MHSCASMWEYIGEKTNSQVFYFLHRKKIYSFYPQNFDSCDPVWKILHAGDVIGSIPRKNDTNPDGIIKDIDHAFNIDALKRCKYVEAFLKTHLMSHGLSGAWTISREGENIDVYSRNFSNPCYGIKDGWEWMDRWLDGAVLWKEKFIFHYGMFRVDLPESNHKRIQEMESCKHQKIPDYVPNIILSPTL